MRAIQLIFNSSRDPSKRKKINFSELNYELLLPTSPVTKHQFISKRNVIEINSPTHLQTKHMSLHLVVVFRLFGAIMPFLGKGFMYYAKRAFLLGFMKFQ